MAQKDLGGVLRLQPRPRSPSDGTAAPRVAGPCRNPGTQGRHLGSREERVQGGTAVGAVLEDLMDRQQIADYDLDASIAEHELETAHTMATKLVG